MFPIHLDLGFKVFYYYEGFYFLISILVGSWLVMLRLKKARLNPEVFMGNLTWILMGAILGARITHFLFWDLKAILADPLSFLRFWEGGLSITGGIAGGVLAGFICFRREKVDFWHYFAVASPAVLIGQAVGRIGCFLNGDAWGIPTSLPWGVSLPKFGTNFPSLVANLQVRSEAWLWSVARGDTSPLALSTVPLHPTQVYEGIGDLVLAALVIILARSLSVKNGPWSKVFWLHLGGYSFLRFGLEFLHGDRDVTIWAGMTALQLGLVAFGMLSVVLYARAVKAT